MLIGCIGMVVCYDVCFFGLFDVMDEIDILVLFVVFMQVIGVVYWYILLGVRVVEKQCFVVVVN